MKKIAIFASGTGTNAENITRFFNEGNRVRVDLVLVDVADAPVVERMRALGVDTAYYPKSIWRHDAGQIVDMLRARDIDLVALAGFNSLVAPEIVEAYNGRLLNLHPSLLPEFGGKGMYGHHVHEAVLAAGREESGCTVHYVDNDLDTGEILMQQKVPVLPGDTPDTLARRVHQAEYSLYPRAIIEALRRLEHRESPEAAWAETLKIPYEEEATQPAPPAMPEMPGAAAQPETTLREEAQPQMPPMPQAPQMPPQPSAPYPNAWNAQQPAGPAPQHGQQTQYMQPAENRPMPPTYLVWSILCTILCCFIPGIIAILYSSKVSALYYGGDYDGAEKASRTAEIWIIASFCLGVLSATLYVPLSLLG